MANPILSAGDKAPEFRAALDDDSEITLAGLAGTRFILYFYPKDDTPGCTTQACDFRDNMDRVTGELGLAVYGVSPDSVKSHAKFKTKYDLPFPLISDPDKAIAQAYGVFREKKNYGRTYLGIVRSTFVVGANGHLETIYDNVRAKGHVARLIRELAKD